MDEGKARLQKYSAATRVLHHIHTAAFIVLFLTGLILFLPPLRFLAEDGWTRNIHRIGAVVFILAPLISFIVSPRRALAAVKEAFVWNRADLGWVKAAPNCYFLCDESSMPPQGHMNTGQKLWWLIVVVSSAAFIVTGLIMWFLPFLREAFQWMVFIHDVAFILAGGMLFVHIYLGVFHPIMTDAWSAITNGTVSEDYAKAHHGLWYQEQVKERQPEREVVGTKSR